MEPGDAACGATENLQTARGRGTTPPGHWLVLLTQHRFRNTGSDRVYAYWRRKGRGGFKRQMRPTARIHKGVTIGQSREKATMNRRASSSVRGQLTAPGPWSEEGQRSGGRTS